VERLAQENRVAAVALWAAREEATRVARESAEQLQRKLKVAAASATAAAEGFALQAVRAGVSQAV
jgi:hypothetical protein